MWRWSYDGPLDGVFEAEDSIVRGVAGIVKPALTEVEIARSFRVRPQSVAAYDLYLRGLQRLHAEGIADNSAARAFFNQAYVLNSNNSMILIHSAWAKQVRHAMGLPGWG